jgi:hypothetical protein
VVSNDKRTFNLPDGKIAFGSTVPVKGTGVATGFMDGYGNTAALYNALNSGQSGTYYGLSLLSNINQTLPKYGAGTDRVNTDIAVGITTDSSKSGIVAELSSGATAIIKY